MLLVKGATRYSGRAMQPVFGGRRNSCNAAFMNGGSDWIEAEKMTEELWEPKWRAKEP